MSTEEQIEIDNLKQEVAQLKAAKEEAEQERQRWLNSYLERGVEIERLKAQIQAIGVLINGIK